MPNDEKELMRSLPAVDTVLQFAQAAELSARYGRKSVTEAVRTVIGRIRKEIMQSGSVDPAACEVSSMVESAARLLGQSAQPKLKRVINATGIILHTGLGRAVMPDAARKAVDDVTGYCNIQINQQDGTRGRREACILELVTSITGAEEAALVNNNAGATLLVLAALCEGREAVVSRGELVEIGGSFRLPDVMQMSGAVLREVGTTNKTHLRDYEKAITPNTGLILKVHKSNYQIVGFTKEVGIAELAQLGMKRSIPVVDDIGSGALVNLEAFGAAHEPTVQESLQAGADVVLFSTDKLIGGPQGGLIVGRKELLDRIRSHPLYRALRVCKMTLAALESTLRLFTAPDRLAQTHPIYAMLAKTPAETEKQARELAARITEAQPSWTVSVVRDISYLGGGSLPGMELPTFAVSVTSRETSADELARRFRLADPPVIPRIKEGAVMLDMRTVSPDEVREVAAAVSQQGTVS